MRQDNVAGTKPARKALLYSTVLGRLYLKNISRFVNSFVLNTFVGRYVGVVFYITR